MAEITKNTGISVGVVALIMPLLFWFSTVKADKKDVDKLEGDVEKAEEDIVEGEKRDIKHANLMENIQKTQERIIKSIDKLDEKIEEK